MLTDRLKTSPEQIAIAVVRLAGYPKLQSHISPEGIPCCYTNDLIDIECGFSGTIYLRRTNIPFSEFCIGEKIVYLQHTIPKNFTLEIGCLKLLRWLKKARWGRYDGTIC